ncbi:MAG TPA: LysR family transcriptional regulator [Acidobacteriota bacterium]|jgi:DNA-binding transcriptional LysR family regulator|nr:LysR family transcriptional regulator [Acidobacteriota bacterium]
MDLRQLEILKAIVEAGSFTGAGEKLHVSQSAISRQILLLEDELNEPIFLRVGRKIRITPAGEVLLQLSHRVFQDFKETVAVIGESKESLTGTLRLVGGMTVCLYVFPTLLKEFRRMHPNVEINLTAGSSEKFIEKIRAGIVDLGLLTLPIDEPDLVTLPVLKEELLLVTHKRHPLSRRKKIAPQDLVRQHFVLFEIGSNTRRVLDEFFVRESIKPLIVMDTENVEIIKAMIRADLGITIIPYQAVAREVRSGQFFCSRIVGPHLMRETGWVYLRSNRVPRVVQEMLLAFERILPRLRLSPPGRKSGTDVHS